MRAPGKINLCLFLGPTRPDGRHELVSVMQAVDLADELALEPGDGADEVLCPGVEGDNLALAAVRAFRARTGWDGPPVRVRIAKRLPVAAGMAGGSADAAAVLRVLAAEAGLEDDDLLREIAAGLGADVPAQVRPGRWLATGAGERVRRLEDPAPYGVLVLPGERGLSTPAVFAEADRQGSGRDPAGLAEALAAVEPVAGDLPAALVVNELADAARALDPTIDVRLELARAHGAEIALVSGSGPTVLGLFGAVQEARAAAVAIGGRARAAQPWGARR